MVAGLCTTHRHGRRLSVELSASKAQRAAPRLACSQPERRTAIAAAHPAGLPWSDTAVRVCDVADSSSHSARPRTLHGNARCALYVRARKSAS